MRCIVISDKMEVSGSGAAAFRNMAVWESGYNICLDVCRAADRCRGNSDQNNVSLQQLKSAATSVPLNLSKSASYRLGKQYIRFLKSSFVSSKQLATLLLICHDLDYIPTENFLELNSKLNIFSSKLWRYIKYSERKARKRKS